MLQHDRQKALELYRGKHWLLRSAPERREGRFAMLLPCGVFPSLTHGVHAPMQKCLLVTPSYAESPEALTVWLPTPLSEAERYLGRGQSCADGSTGQAELTQATHRCS